MSYRTVKDLCLLNIYAKYRDKLQYMTNDELDEVFQRELKKFNNDFLSFYQRTADIKASLSFANVIPTITLEAKNVLGACCLYRSIEDIWDFYDYEDDIYEDGLLRIWEEGGRLHILDVFSPYSTRVIK